jgi:hypothetical protein
VNDRKRVNLHICGQPGVGVYICVGVNH